MCERLFHPVTLVAYALFALAANVSADATVPWAVASQPVRLANGTPVLFRVTASQPVRTLSGRWLGHEIEFTFDATRQSWFALAGVSLETKPGTYPLELHAETTAGQATSFEKRIRVERQRYPRVMLKVPARYTAPSPEDQRQIAEDKVIKAEAFKTLSATREWRGAFSPPVRAEISDLFGVERVFNGSVESTHQGGDFRVAAGASAGGGL